MESTIQQQLDISRSLLEALDRMTNSFESMLGNTNGQNSFMQKMMQEMKSSDTRLSNTASNAQAISNEMSNSVADGFVQNIENQTKDSTNAINSSMKNSSTKSSKTLRNALKNNKLFKKIKDKTNAINVSLKNSTDVISRELTSAVSKMEKYPRILKIASIGVYILGKAIDLMMKIKDAFSSFGRSLIRDFFGFLFSFLKGLLKAAVSLIGAATKFFMFSLSLPFTIGKFASQIGNTIRRDIVEVIQSAGEEAKEAFDLTSHIGKSADKMTGMAKGLLKTFQSPRSRLSRLFGTGAAGAASFLKETFKAVADMGHYSEVFGQSIMGNLSSAQYLIEMQRAMGLSAKEFAYYAMESYISGKSPIDTLHETSETIKNAADRNGLDFKALTKEFHTLRTNIVDFGNLTSNEVANLTVKLRKMGIQTDDAVNVFKKFTSLEEASKTSAMLFQSFEMNIDAFDLLTARDPGEMLQQFRDSMFQTGRAFKDLDRHEKALMSNITGVSEKGLQSLMNYMSQGLEYEEARKRMEEQDPTEQQTKMVKGLTSTIKLLQKTMMFESPFQAFFRGLTSNASNQKELRNMVVGLSSLYEDIYHLGFSLDINQIKSLLVPVTTILNKISGTLTGNTFKKVLKHATKTAGDFLGDIGNDLQNSTAQQYYKLEKQVSSVIFKLNKDQIKAVREKEKVIFEAISSTLDLTNPKRNANAQLLGKMKGQGILEEYKKGVFRVAKDVTTEEILRKMQYISGQYDDNSPVQKEILGILNVVDTKFEEQISQLDVFTQKVLKDSIKKSQNRHSIEGRINNLYENIMDLLTEGTPTFNSIKDIGGRIMGSVVRGIGYGIAASFQIFSGSLDAGVDMLGLETSKTLRKEFGVKPGKKLRAIDLLGISTKETGELSDNFGKESAKFVLNLPTFMSFAGSFLLDFKDVIGDFAGGLLGFFGEMSSSIYDNTDNKLLKAYMAANLDFVKAEKYSHASKGLDLLKGKTSIDAITGSFITDESKDNKYADYDYKMGALPKIFGTIQGFKDNLHKDSYAYKYLSDSKVISQIKYLEKNAEHIGHGNLKVGDFLLGFEDLEIEERITAGLHILSNATELNANQPSAIHRLLDNKKTEAKTLNLINSSYINNKRQENAMKKKLSDLISETPMNSVSSYTGGFNLFGDDPIDEMNKYRDKINKNISLEKNHMSRFKTKDYHLKGKGAVITIGNSEYHLDDHDAIYASKKGGFLNKLYIEIFDTHNQFTEELFCIVKENNNKKILEVENYYKGLIANKSLKDSLIDNNQITKEVSDEEVLNLVNLCIEIVQLNSSRKIVTNNVKVNVAT